MVAATGSDAASESEARALLDNSCSDEDEELQLHQQQRLVTKDYKLLGTRGSSNAYFIEVDADGELIGELVGRPGQQQRRRRGVRAALVAAAVGGVVLALVIAGAVLLSGDAAPLSSGSASDAGSGSSAAAAAARGAGPSVDPNDVLDSRFATHGFNGSWLSTDPGVSLDDVLNSAFASEDEVNGTWVTDSELLFRNEHNEPMLFDAASKKIRALLKHPMTIPHSTIKLEISADLKYLLAVYNYSKVFRHTYLAQYDIINIETGERRPLTVSGNREHDARVLQLAIWAPVGNGIAFVYHNDIFYRPSVESLFHPPSSSSSTTSPPATTAPSPPPLPPPPPRDIRLTSDGSFSTVYHGVPDWVYEEEVFSSNTAMWFSPDGSKLAYASFNDSNTRVMSIPYYGPPTVLEFQYPRAINLRYPKPGTPNPTVSLTVAHLTGEELKSVNLAPPENLRDPVLSTVAWANADEVAAIWMNRVQNKGELVICKAMKSQCVSVQSLEEKSGWLDLFVPPLFSEDGSRLVLIYPHDQGIGIGAFRHVTLLDRDAKGSSFKPLTSGKFVVTEIVAWDEKAHLIYFLGTDEKDSSIQHLYSVSDDPTSAPNNHTCISCQFKNAVSKEPCLYNKAAFSKDSSFFMHSCSGPDVPEVSLYNKEFEHLMVWEDNNEVRKRLKGHVLPTMKQLAVDVPGGFQAQVQLLLPPDVDISGKTKYPLLVNVYGGPDSNQITRRFSVDWSSYLTVNRSIIYAAIDGRGSGRKGNDMLFAGYRHLGSVEIDDQVNVTKYLQETFPFIDKNRTGIWGWSYGGYSTGMALAKDKQGIFKCGISVAPVTDWAYYDTIYTERYMGLPTPSDNLEGYVESELNNKLDNFRNKMFFLVHGTLDDNVHYQQSMMLSKVLEHNDILFRQQSYPDEEHGLAGVRPHLYHSLENFLEECFNLK